MSNEVRFTIAFVGHVRNNLQSANLKWKDLIQKIIVVSTQVIHVCGLVFHHLQHAIEESGVFSLPAPRLFQLPAIDDVAVKDEVVAVKLLQKSSDFFCLGALGSQVNIRNDDGFVVSLHTSRFASQFLMQTSLECV